MEKKSLIKEVHKLVNQDYPELYNKISKILGESCPFARFSIGTGYYIWSDNRCDWHKMVAADSSKQEEVRIALSDLREVLVKKFGEKQTEPLLTFPDDSYIFYNDNEGEMKVLVAGWGFKKPVRTRVKPDVKIMATKNPITISFLYNEERLPDYEFVIKLNNTARKLRTNSDGVCNLGNLRTGETYTLYDIQHDKKEYRLDIKEGDSHYDIDQTEYIKVEFIATTDGQPITGEEINAQFQGKAYSITTGLDGKAKIDLPFIENETLSAQLRDEGKSINLQHYGNLIEFAFESEPEPQPAPLIETDIVATVMIDNYACPGKDVTIEYNDLTYEGITAADGQFIQHVKVEEGKVCQVSVEGFTTQQDVLEDKPENVFRFETNTPPLPLPPIPAPGIETVSPKLIIKRENGELATNYPVTVEHKDEWKSYVSDGNGTVTLPKIAEGDAMTVTDGNDDKNTEVYTITEGQEEYVFTIPDEGPKPEQNIRITFKDKDGNPIKCNGVKFHQEGRDDVDVILDNNGTVSLTESTFKNGVCITASIKGREEDYAPIPFTTEENEYEYLIQEKPAKRSWLSLIGQLLAVVAAIAACALVWPLIEGFCLEMFEAVYY